MYPGGQGLSTSTTAAEVDDEHGEEDAEAGEDHRAQVEGRCAEGTELGD